MLLDPKEFGDVEAGAALQNILGDVVLKNVFQKVLPPPQFRLVPASSLLYSIK